MIYRVHGAADLFITAIQLSYLPCVKGELTGGCTVMKDYVRTIKSVPYFRPRH